VVEGDHRLSLAQEALEQTRENLERFGVGLSISGAKALKALLKALEEGLRGRLPARYHLASLDPGTGKSCAVSSFLKAWKRRGFDPDGSILVGLSRLEEIEAYVRASGLGPSDFGVLTSNDQFNALGVPQGQHQSARVLFTTQQMILSRTKGRLFAEADEFHFRGQTRALRVWDETILPALPVVIRRDYLLSLCAPMRAAHRTFVEALEAFALTLRYDSEPYAVAVPASLIDAAPSRNDVQRLRMGLPKDLRDTLERILLLSGQECLVMTDSREGVTLVGTSRSLPSDFAPAVVLDASGRVRATYAFWREHRGGLEVLPKAKHDYRKLRLKVWETSCGKDALGDAKRRAKLADVIAKEVDQVPGEWLIVVYKDAGERLVDAVRSLVKDPQCVHCLTWGRHLGTNDYAHVDNVVIVGPVTYRNSDYVAHLMAAAGLGPEDVTAQRLRTIRTGEYQHHLLQALCRASVRKSKQGVAGACHAYLITSPSPGLGNVLRQTFPGVTLIEWMPSEPPLTGKAAEAAEYLRERFADPSVQSVRKAEVRDALAMRAAAFSNNVMKREAFLSFLAEEYLTHDRYSFRRMECEFPPLEEDGAYTLLTHGRLANDDEEMVSVA